MGSELPGKDVEDLFSNPTAFGERRESKVVWADFTETYTKKQNKISKNHLVDSVAKLRQYQEKHGNQNESDNAAYLRCELRIPSEEEIE